MRSGSVREVPLLYSTGVAAVDRNLKGIIGFCELLFPGRIRGYYLQGSYARGDATPVSDIDLLFVFAGDFESAEEKERAWCVDQFSEWLVGRQLDIVPTTEHELHSTKLMDATAIMDFKVGAVLLYGQDIRDAIPLPSRELYVRSCLAHALRAVSWHHRHPQPLRFPLNYPDESGEFYGFNQAMYVVDESVAVGTERLVYAVVRIAGAFVALKTDALLFSKRACVEGYRELVADEWAGFVTEVFTLCHDQWRNLIPTDEADRRRLRDFYARILHFENYFLENYHKVLEADLNSTDEQLVTAAVERLNLTFR